MGCEPTTHSRGLLGMRLIFAPQAAMLVVWRYSRLAMLPGETHLGLVERADWLLSMIGEFLDAPVPGTEWAAGGRV